MDEAFIFSSICLRISNGDSHVEKQGGIQCWSEIPFVASRLARPRVSGKSINPRDLWKSSDDLRVCYRRLCKDFFQHRPTIREVREPSIQQNTNCSGQKVDKNRSKGGPPKEQPPSIRTRTHHSCWCLAFMTRIGGWWMWNLWHTYHDHIFVLSCSFLHIDPSSSVNFFCIVPSLPFSSLMIRKCHMRENHSW
jgi:hypothetical protein